MLQDRALYRRNTISKWRIDGAIGPGSTRWFWRDAQVGRGNKFINGGLKATASATMLPGSKRAETSVQVEDTVVCVLVLEEEAHGVGHFMTLSESLEGNSLLQFFPFSS